MAKPTLPPEPPENLVLVPLRAIRGTFDDHTRRFRVERELVGTRRDITRLI